MLMSGQQDVEVRLLRQAAGNIFLRIREERAGLQVPLIAAVINTDTDITVGPQLREGRSGCRDRLGNRKLCQVLRPFPQVHIIRHHAGKAYPKAVFQGFDPGFLQLQLAPAVADIGTNADRLHGMGVFLQHLIAEIEVMVTQGIHIQAHGIEGKGRRMHRKGIPMLQIILQEGRALQRITAVRHDDIAVVPDRCRNVHQASGEMLPALVIHRQNLAVGIRGVVNLKRFLHASCLSLSSASRGSS